MAEKIIFEYEKMKGVVTGLNDLSAKYKSAGEKFNTDFISGIKNWEGDSKDAVAAFMNGSVKEFTEQTIPEIIQALSSLLKANVEQMQKADSSIAANIPK